MAFHSPGDVPMKLRCLPLPGAVLLAVATSGCHDLQPPRLHRLNRGPGLSPEAYYSISDPDADGDAVRGKALPDPSEPSGWDAGPSMH